MALPTRPTEAIDIIPRYNINAYDEVSNPYGFDDGGHIYNHLQSFRYVVQIENYLTQLATYVENLRQAVAADLGETSQDVTDAGAARDKARDWANAPVGTQVETGKFSGRHYASAASDSATASEQSRQAAAAILDQFDDRFLGAKSTDPTTDNDGNALVIGTLVFNTTDMVMKVWNGSAWQVLVPDAAGYLLRSGGTMTGLINFVAAQFASQAQAEAGTDQSKVMNALRVAQAIAKLSPQPGLSLVSSATISSPVQFVDISVPNTLFDNFELRITDLTFDAETNGPTLRIITNGTVLSAADSYQDTNVVTLTVGGNMQCAVTSSRNLIALSGGGNVGNVKTQTPVNLVLDIFRPALTSGGRSFAFRGGFQYNSESNGDPLSLISGTGRVKGAGKVDGLRISQPNVANIIAGKFDLYGHKKQ